MESVKSAVILAGGSGRRIGEEKSFLDFFGKTMIERAVGLVKDVVQDVVVVARDEEQSERILNLTFESEVRLTWDLVPGGYGPVAGLAAGMAFAKGKYALAVGCDLPFLNTKVLERLFQMASGYDAVVPMRFDGFIEPLHAVYLSENMALACKRAVKQNYRKMRAPLSELNVNWVFEDEFYSLDPKSLSFFNINTVEDLIEAKQIWIKKKR